MTGSEHDFLSCDWGTTSFRLRWVSGPERHVKWETKVPMGVKALDERARERGVDLPLGRQSVFEGFLRDQLGTLAGHAIPERPLPLVISGMASSSVGWHELPYARTPFPLDGRSLKVEEISWEKPAWVGATFLISGIATDSDVMRGEEMEVLGIMSDPGLAGYRERSLLILPGTHSKHVRIENRFVRDFRTFMTGELFEVLGRHSLLRVSVNLEAVTGSQWAVHAGAFREGVAWAKRHGMAGALFRVRTRGLLDRCDRDNSAWFLSGILIGAELHEIDHSGARAPVILAATEQFSEPYWTALQMVSDGRIACLRLTPAQTGRATISAHALFMKTQGHCVV